MTLTTPAYGATLALPGPEAWGRVAVGASCGSCGGGPLRFDPASDSHLRSFATLEDEGDPPPGGWWFDGDVAHCETCGQPHVVDVYESATLTIPYGAPSVVYRPCECGWPHDPCDPSLVTLGWPFWDARLMRLRDVILWAGVVPRSLRRDGYTLRAPCELLARRRGRR